MVKPTLEQLKLLYPSVDSEYLNSYIENKLILVNNEEENVSQADVIINDCESRLVSALNEFIQTKRRDKFISSDYMGKEMFLSQMNAIIDSMVTEIATHEVDVAIQNYEMSALLQRILLEHYFTEEPYVEFGGEQKKTSASVSKKKLTKKKANELLSKKNTPQNINEIVQSLKDELSSMYDSWTRGTNKDGTPLSKAVADVKSAMGKANKQLRRITRELSQQVVYDGVNDVKLTVSDDYKIVYYRVEVLDSHICMVCMNLDGKVYDEPLNQVHKNCRGIDVILLKDLETGKYYDSNGKGFGHKLKTQTFEKKFSKLSKRQQRNMLGKSNYELYSQGKLKAEDFISYGRQITKAEADTKIALRKAKSQIKTPQMATRLAHAMEQGLPSVDEMDSKQLLMYEKILGYQKQLYNLVPKKNFKGKARQSYIDDIDAKYVKLQARRDALNKL